ncbi:MAG: SDR family oxidoreductase [Bacteroidetes bacterium]|jgi:dehydrogenase/reductase SDR family member 7B|nr:SDR family oxidoreductase [Bacteroidota bacterium]MBT6685984.1 SDR family oxidoreductase [Bacteroidota bacterium]MBT7144416.1 SDR family oxidoreductase [Bacteroidota bacterium]MBT7490865.1 SDR family oxidoreductase [Bacteroidota bacterium]
MNYTGKIVWITGASSGIGEALTYLFSKEKAKIIISARRENELERVKNNCAENADNIFIAAFDLLDTKNIDELTNSLIKKFGRIDLLINNGGMSQRSYIEETPIENDRKLMEVNFFSSITLTKSVLPTMIKQKSGHIVAISSIVGKFGFPLRSAYSASKHALHGFYETARLELKKKNIKVTIAIPGRVQTNISKNALSGNGKPYGKMDGGQKHGIPVELCAQQIIDAIKKNKKEVNIGGKEVLLVHIRRFFPAIFEKIALKVKST